MIKAGTVPRGRSKLQKEDGKIIRRFFKYLSVVAAESGRNTARRRRCMQWQLVKIALVMLVLGLLAACGSNGSSSRGEDSSLPQETPQVQETPQAQDMPRVEGNGDGQTVQVEITTGEGRQLDITASSDIPDDFPLPVYPEWTAMVAAKTDMGNGFRWNASFQFSGDIAELTQRYASDLKALGYDVEIMEMGQDAKGIMLTGTLDGKPVEGVISIGKAGEMQVISISVGDPL